ncbi:hypothetical protein MFIFM68171_10268 [Madurella fahalii]|uniref:Uncharacterized protein n=1 Tax=Madurella fahalii TaxID=1157608 RepID=A0ABQ0GQP8_9PEZI
MNLPLEGGFIAASHNCTCNPRGFKRISNDWTPQTCAYTSSTTTSPYLPPAPSASSPPTHRLLNSDTLVLRPSLAEHATLLSTLATHPSVPDAAAADEPGVPPAVGAAAVRGQRAQDDAVVPRAAVARRGRPGGALHLREAVEDEAGRARSGQRDARLAVEGVGGGLGGLEVVESVVVKKEKWEDANG